MKANRILATCVALALVACSKQAEKPAATADATPDSPPAVTVNGRSISQATFEFYASTLARKPYAEIAPDDREQIRENLVRMELFAQDAEKNGLLKDPELASAIQISRLQLIQQATAQKLAKDQVPTETELRAEYESQIASTPNIEVRARHIVLSGEDVAQKVIDRLKGGADFATLARQMSTHKDSARNGGELGWFPPNALGPDFATAVTLLKKGETTPHPVQTRMGWHVVQLEETREAQPPPFDKVHDQLGKFVLTKKLAKASDELLKVAKVDPPLNTDSARSLNAAPAAAAAAAPAAAPAPATASDATSAPAEAPKAN
ncbi:MAG TPA: peptidylprolyl isomerase [Steroidobacteraceae bacterium]